MIGGTLFAALTGLLWGGLVRVFVLHHFTYSINSLCHVFGNRDYETDRSVAQPRPDRDPDLRRGLAQQPPRLPDLGHPRPRPLAARHLGAVDRRPREAGPGLGCGPGQPASASPPRRSERAPSLRAALGRPCVPVEPAAAGLRSAGRFGAASPRTATSSPIVGLAVIAGEALQRAGFGGVDREAEPPPPLAVEASRPARTGRCWRG